MKAGTSSFGQAPADKKGAPRVSSVRKSTVVKHNFQSFSSSPSPNKTLNNSDTENVRNSINDAPLGKMREMRKSIAFQMKDHKFESNQAAK